MATRIFKNRWMLLSLEELEPRLPLSQVLPVIGSAPIGPTIGIVPGAPTAIIQPADNDIGPGEGAPPVPEPAEQPVGSFPTASTTTQIA